MNKIVLLVLLVGLWDCCLANKAKCPSRGVPKNLRSCCKGVEDFISSEGENSCSEYKPNNWETTGPRTGGRGRSKIECFIDCIFNSTGYNLDGEFKPDKVPLKYQAAFTTCTNDAQSHRKSPRHPPTINRSRRKGKDKTCNPTAAEIAACVQRQAIMDCPDSDWNNDETRCYVAKDKLRNCPRSPDSSIYDRAAPTTAPLSSSLNSKVAKSASPAKTSTDTTRNAGDDSEDDGADVVA